MLLDPAISAPCATTQGAEDGWEVSAVSQLTALGWVGKVAVRKDALELAYDTPDHYPTSEAACMAAYALGRDVLAQALVTGDARVYSEILHIPLARGIRLRSWTRLALKSRKMPNCDPAEAALIKQLTEEPDYLEALDFHLASLDRRIA